MLQGVTRRVLTPGRLVKHCVVQFGAYLAVPHTLAWMVNWSQEEGAVHILLHPEFWKDPPIVINLHI
jgi:hypothetical protein